MTWRGARSEPHRRRIRIGCLPVLGVVAATGVFLVLVHAFHPRTMVQTQSLPAPQARARATHLRPVSDFAAIADPQTRSLALFMEAGRVIQSPRCMNCHPRDDRPTQTDTMRPHTPWVSRGVDGHGGATMRCSSCHRDTNFEPSRQPGNPRWRLAPPEMAWQGKTLGEICRQIQDPARGGMSHAALLRHMSEDALVGWAWRPGGDRTPAPGTQAEFGAIIEAWLASGGKCPA